jgi:phosphopantetheinyl transferase (holo-ACP synthase)
MKHEIMEAAQYHKYIRKIEKKDFISLFQSIKPEDWYSPGELNAFYPGNMNSLAGRYLIKMAVADILGVQNSMNEIEILNNDMGKPEIVPGIHIRQFMQQKGIKNILCSISHSRHMIIGLTIICMHDAF